MAKNTSTLGVVAEVATQLLERGITAGRLGAYVSTTRTRTGRIHHHPSCVAVAGRTHTSTSSHLAHVLSASVLCERCYSTLVQPLLPTLESAHVLLEMAARAEQAETSLETGHPRLCAADAAELREWADKAELFVTDSDHFADREWARFAHHFAERLTAVASLLDQAQDTRIARQTAFAALDLMSGASSSSATMRIAPAQQYPHVLVGNASSSNMDLVNYAWAEFWRTARSGTPDQAAAAAVAAVDVDVWEVPSIWHVPQVPLPATTDLQAAVLKVWREHASAALADVAHGWATQLSTSSAQQPAAAAAVSGLASTGEETRAMLSALERRPYGPRNAQLVSGPQQVLDWIARYAKPANYSLPVTVTPLTACPVADTAAVMDTTVAALAAAGSEADVELMWDASLATLAA